MLKVITIILTVIINISCSRVSTLSLNHHKFNTPLEKLVWLQVPGLTDEHMAILRLVNRSDASTTVFENMTCSGKAWSYNLHNLRPVAKNGLKSQMLGTKNIKGSCQDYGKTAIWDYFVSNKDDVVILENTLKKDSLRDLRSCKVKNADQVTMFTMLDSKKIKQEFHYQEKGKKYSKGNLYRDKSCSGKKCFSNLLKNVSHIWNEKKISEKNTFFLIRDFSYLYALKNKDILTAREKLFEISRVASYFNKIVKKNPNVLFLITSSEAINLEFPAQGVAWAKFETEGKNAIFKRSSLMSSVFASGAGAENFCGIYDENEILKRILWRAKNQNIVKEFFDQF